MYFVILAFEKLTGLSKKEYWWGHIYTMLLVIIGWVIFRSTGMGNAFLVIHFSLFFIYNLHAATTCKFVVTQTYE